MTFATPALARQAVSARNNRSTVLLVELLSRTREEKRMGYRRGEEASATRSHALSKNAGWGQERERATARVSQHLSFCCCVPVLRLTPATSLSFASWRIFGRTGRDCQNLKFALTELTAHERSTTNAVELARPGRPPADASSGSRLILGALGIRRPKPKTSDATATRKSANSKGGVRGRGAKQAQAPPAETTDSWDM